MNEVKSTEDIVGMISDVLVESDGEYIEEIANQILSTKVRYIEDSLFEVEDE